MKHHSSLSHSALSAFWKHFTLSLSAPFTHSRIHTHTHGRSSFHYHQLLPYSAIHPYTYQITHPIITQWPRVLRRRSTAACLLRLWVRITPGAWKSFSCECCVLSDRGLCDGLITRPEKSYRLWCVVVCDLQGCWQVLSPTYFPMYFVWWWEYFVWYYYFICV